MATSPDIHSTAAERKMKYSAARLSIIVALFLIALKTTSGWLTGSLSVWASLLDSVLDLFASTMNFIAVRAASRPADEIMPTDTVKRNL
jgi:ferrous-iron efflux pump FieF